VSTTRYRPAPPGLAGLELTVLEGLYFRAPARVQNVGLTVAGVRARQRRYGRPFPARAQEYLDRESWSPAEVDDLRNARLAETLRLASQTPHYQRVFKAMGGTWRDFTDPTAFAELPVTEKQHVQRDPDAFRPRPSQRTDALIRTSGTTGSAVQVFKSRNAIAEQWAVWWRYRGWHGLDRSTPLALFAGRRVIPEESGAPFWRIDSLGHEVRYSSYHLSETTVHGYVQQLERSRPPWVHGFASAVNHLALLMLQSDLSLSHPLSAVTLGAENVTPWHLTNIEAAFGVQPVQHYGLAEGVANVSECDRHRLHIDEDFSYVELVPRPPTGMLQVVGTNFGNDAMVLLRYATNDIVSPATAPCDCGRWGRVLRSLDGRADDSIVLPDGRLVGTLEDAFRDVSGVAEAQITQTADGALLVRYIDTERPEDGTELQIEQNLRRFLGPEIEISFAPVAHIPRTASGKTRLIVSELARH
jgi:phenylacetate-CoA ligase